MATMNERSDPTVPQWDFVTEFWRIRRSIEVVTAGQRFKLDVLQHNDGHFSARVYVEKPLHELGGVWVHYFDFPWTRRDTADELETQALSFLRERVSG